MLVHNDEELENFYSLKKRISILGQERYVDEIKSQYLNRIWLEKEIPEKNKAKAWGMIEAINHYVSKEFMISYEQLLESKRGKINLPRQCAISLAKEISGAKHQDIAEAYKLESYKTIYSHFIRMNQIRAKNKRFNSQYERIKEELSKRRLDP